MDAVLRLLMQRPRLVRAFAKMARGFKELSCVRLEGLCALSTVAGTLPATSGAGRTRGSTRSAPP